ncbi:MAG: tRNA-splicing endonuclease subunit [Alectoria fallacina]|uniref:tRNA-splicing endonuclease subunit Sen34 n=1 Tax=Alectoria fallacina TaxID=1903189 RepID=A0A8H3J9Y8_9LECA|nr:MAG: tRNA-splicing endonuclease subunit [Alectoria fallacina]
MTAPTTPNLPLPVFQISQKVERYLLYDINVITWLRKNHNILGVLIGTLPQIPQQNVFLGLPLELQPEEARLLVESRLAYVVNDWKWHAKDLASTTAEQKEAFKADLRQEGARIAKDFESSKKSRTHKALKRIQGKTNTALAQRSSASPAPVEEEDTSEESLFGESLTRETTVTPFPEPSRVAEPDSKPWTSTPTTPYPLLSPPPSPGTQDLPKVNPSSYALFKHLHSLGYFLSPGIRFGCQFSVYPGDPLRFHSHFLTMSAEWDEEIDLLDLVGGGRLGTGVKKGWLIGGVEQMAQEGEGGKDSGEGPEEGVDGRGRVRTFCIEWGGM